MIKEDFLSKIQEMVTDSNLKEAIHFGIKYLKDGDFIILASRHKRIEKAFDKGIITFEQLQVELLIP